MIYMFLSNNPSSGDINSSNLPCLKNNCHIYFPRDRLVPVRLWCTLLHDLPRFFILFLWQVFLKFTSGCALDFW